MMRNFTLAIAFVGWSLEALVTVAYAWGAPSVITIEGVNVAAELWRNFGLRLLLIVVGMLLLYFAWRSPHRWPWLVIASSLVYLLGLYAPQSIWTIGFVDAYAITWTTAKEFEDVPSFAVRYVACPLVFLTSMCFAVVDLRRSRYRERMGND